MNEDSALFKQGGLLIHMNRFQKAGEVFRKILTSNPKDSSAHAFLSFCLTQEKKFDLAESEAKLALGFDAQNHLAYYSLAILSWKRHQLIEALEMLSQGLVHNPESKILHYQQAAYLWAIRRYPESRAACQRVLQLDPNHTDALLLLSKIESKHKKHDKAFDIAKVAVGMDPAYTNTHSVLGYNFANTGSYSEALDHFSEALRLNPTNSQARKGLAIALIAQNPTGNAILNFRRSAYHFGPRLQLISFCVALVLFFIYVTVRILHPGPETLPIASVLLTVVATMVCASFVFWVLFWISEPISFSTLLFVPKGWQTLTLRSKINTLVFISLFSGGTLLSLWGLCFHFLSCLLLGIGLLALAHPAFYALKTENILNFLFCGLLIFLTLDATIECSWKGILNVLFYYGIFNVCLLVKIYMSKKPIELQKQ